MDINHIVLDDMVVDQLVMEIKDKKTLQNMDAVFIKKHIQKFLSNNMNTVNKLDNKKSKEYKELIKYVRGKCHDIFEIFQSKIGSGERLALVQNIEHYKKESNLPILESHLSTKERLPILEDVYKNIFEFTGYPKSILDIGCGMNPFSLPYMDIDIEGLVYYASELSYDDLMVIDDYFQRIGLIESETFRCDVANEYEILSKYPADICFAFKLFDVLETQNENVTYKIIKSLKCKYLVASFPLKNIKNRDMKRKKVHYFERFLSNLNLLFKTLEYENEIFYIVYDKHRVLEGKKAKDL